MRCAKFGFVLQIINDRSTRGKCYGFVTYTNPRSAIDAINDMDGRVCMSWKKSCRWFYSLMSSAIRLLSLLALFLMGFLTSWRFGLEHRRTGG